MDEYMLRKMEDQREMALKTLSKIFPSFTNELAKILAFSFFEEHESAQTIASHCNLGTMDFCAIIDDEVGYKDEFIKELDLFLQEEAYERSLRYA